MTEGIATALIGAGQAVLVALLATVGIYLGRLNGKVNRVRDDAAVTREHVANDHVAPDGTPINLRQEQDERHAANEAKLNTIIGRLDNTDKAIGGIRDQIRLLTDADNILSHRLNTLDERTQPRNTIDRKEPP